MSNIIEIDRDKRLTLLGDCKWNSEIIRNGSCRISQIDSLRDTDQYVNGTQNVNAIFILGQDIGIVVLHCELSN